MKKSILFFCSIPFFLAAQEVMPAASYSDTATARAAYQQQQALAEVPRLIQQFDQLVQNQDAIVTRLQRLESAANNNQGDLQSEVAALRAEVAELRASIRREQDAMRNEIVADLAKRMAAMQARMAPPPPPPAPVAVAPAPVAARPVAQPPPPPAIGPHYEYIVEKGQTLAMIAKGFDTTVGKIIAANPGLKPNMLRVGQKLIIPAEEPPAKPASRAPARKGKK